MNRENKRRCECGGETKYYDGALGYEAMVCQRCGYHWSGQTEAHHEQQLKEYRQIKRALTEDLVQTLADFVESWPQFDTDDEVNGGDLVEFCSGWYHEAKAAIAKAKGDNQ